MGRRTHLDLTSGAHCSSVVTLDTQECRECTSEPSNNLLLNPGCLLGDLLSHVVLTQFCLLGCLRTCPAKMDFYHGGWRPVISITPTRIWGHLEVYALLLELWASTGKEGPANLANRILPFLGSGTVPVLVDVVALITRLVLCAECWLHDLTAHLRPRPWLSVPWAGGEHELGLRRTSWRRCLVQASSPAPFPLFHLLLPTPPRTLFPRAIFGAFEMQNWERDGEGKDEKAQGG